VAEKLATGAQLWRLCQAGRLKLLDEPEEPITQAQASKVLDDVMGPLKGTTAVPARSHRRSRA
jgi:hypothetical protein